MNRPDSCAILSLTLTAAALTGIMWLTHPARTLRPANPIQPTSSVGWPTFSLLPTPLCHVFTRSTPALWPAGAAEAIDPFAGKSTFTLHLENYGPGDWCHPLPGANVISPYGERDGRMHTGTDLKTAPGDTIRATFAGIVIMSEPFSGYGNCVQLRHSNGLTTLYSHNERNLVQAGQAVATGQPIAIEGGTGRATTEHLHFETRVAGQPYNSELIFDHEKGTLRRHSIVFHRNGKQEIR